MKHQKIEAGACDTGPNENCVLNSAAHSRNRPSPRRRSVIPSLPECSHHASRADQRAAVAEWKRRLISEGHFSNVELVSLDALGPAHLLGGVRVCIGYRDAESFVWLVARPWGSHWANANKCFIDREHVSSAVSYALKLARAIRKAALAEQARRERHQAAIMREKFGGAL